MPDFTLTDTETAGSTTYVTTETVTNTTNLATPNGGITTPSCALPSIVPQCQSQWNAFLADNLSVSDILPFTFSQSNSAACASSSSSWESGLTNYYDNVEPVRYADDPFTPLYTQATVPVSACSAMVSSFLEPPEQEGNFAHI